MVERAAVAQHIQIGVETTPGTPVAAAKQLRSLSFTPSPRFTVQQFRPSGQKYVSLAILGEEWVEAAITGEATYDELVYPLSSLLGAATVTTGAATTPQAGSTSWSFVPNTFSADNAKTFTVQHGDASTRVDTFSYGIVNDIQLQMARQNMSVSGSMMGQRLTDNVSFTTNPTFIPLVPIVPNTLNVFLDSTAAGIGITRMSRIIHADWHLANKNGPIWTLDSTQNSWAATVELVPTLTMTLLMEADAQGMAQLNNIRASTTQFMRISSTGPVIAGGTTPYSFTLDVPVKLVGTQGFSDSSGLYAIQWDFVGVFDSSLALPTGGTGGSMTLTLVNTTTAL